MGKWHIDSFYLHSHIYMPPWGLREAYSIELRGRDDHGVSVHYTLVSVYVDDAVGGLVREVRVYETTVEAVEHCEEMREVLGHQGHLTNLTGPQVREKLEAIVAELRLRFL